MDSISNYTIIFPFYENVDLKVKHKIKYGSI